MPVCKRPMSIDGDNWDKKKSLQNVLQAPVYSCVCYRSALGRLLQVPWTGVS